MNDLDAIRERHQQEGDFDACEYCGSKVVEDGWPCDTRIVLDALDSSRKAHRDAHEMASWYEDRERAARADADRLAEALRAYMEAEDSFRDTTYDTAIEALRLHDEAERE